MSLTAFNRMRARQKAEEEALKAEEAKKAEELEVASPKPVVESVPEPVVAESVVESIPESVVEPISEPIKVEEQTSPAVEKPKRKRTDAEKLKGKKE